MVSLGIALIIAIVAPFIWGFMNILDKYVVSVKIKNPTSFAVMAAIVNIIYGLILALFLNWKGLGISLLVPSIIAGTLYGIQYFIYYQILKKEDASSVIGLFYTYPLLVALLSFLFLNEVISSMSYLGVILVILGALILTLRMKKIGWKTSLWMLGLLILDTAVAEFLMKVATNNLPALNGVSVSVVFMGVIVLFALFSKSVRIAFRKEIRNFRWAFLNEFFNFLGIITIYLGMSVISATVFTAMAAIQPLAVLIYEKLLFSGSQISRDRKLWPKLIGILLIVLGIILLYIPELLKL